jgi:hypothetical protein
MMMNFDQKHGIDGVSVCKLHVLCLQESLQVLKLKTEDLEAELPRVEQDFFLMKRRLEELLHREPEAATEIQQVGGVDSVSAYILSRCTDSISKYPWAHNERKVSSLNLAASSVAA